ncbi:reverse transcriptase domain-containing protein [Tanacetum coccineum]
MGNPLVGSTFAYHPQEGYIPLAFTNNSVPSYNGPMHPTVTPSSNYPFYTQPMYAPPNMTTYPNPAGPFIDSACSITPFVHRIKDYPLPDGLKMPSHIGSYNGKGDPYNFLHLFEGAIHIQQKKFTKTHLAVHNIKQREGESTRAFITRYTDDTLQILGLHKEQRISGFVHGLRTRSLVEHLSMDLPSTYKGLREKTYTWVEEERQVAHMVKGVKEKKEKNTGTRSEERKKEEKKPILKKVHVLMISKKNRNMKKRPTNHDEIWEITFPPLLNVCSADPVIIKVYISGRQVNIVYLDGGSSCEVIYEHFFLKLKPSIRSLRIDSNTPFVGFLGEQSWPLGEIPLEITIGEGPIALGRTAMQQMGIVVSTVHGAIKFHTPRGIGTVFSEYNSQKPKEEEGGSTNKYQGTEEIFLSCIDTEERVVINDKTNKAKEEKPSPRKEQSDPQPGRRINRSGDLTRNEVPNMGIKSHGREKRQRKMEAAEHEIKFRGRNSIKGQILADFLAKTLLLKNKEAKNKEVKRKEPEPDNTWKLFTDGASSSDGSRAGLMVFSPEGKEYTYALRFAFETTNNEVEYEALLAGLCIAKEMEIRELIIFVDSQLVANQVKGLFEARQPTIKQYLKKTMDLLLSLHSYSIEHIKREQNKKADALSKLASMTFSKLAKEVLVEVIQNKSIAKKEVTNIVQEEGDNWMTLIREYLRSGTLPDDPQKARKLRIKALLYKMIKEKLCQRPWLRCVGPMQAKNIIKEVHKWSCGMHSGSRSVVSKIARLGYHWPSMHKDAKELIQKCEACQIYSLVNREVEVTNIEITKGMERRLGKAHQAWIDELPQVLWAHRTTPKSKNRETPFSLVYGSEAVIPIEIKKREMASIKEVHYKQRREGYYNKNVKPSMFKPGTYVLRLNNASKAEYQGKMGPTWEGPYVIRKAYGDGAYKLETLSGEAVDRTWNGTNLRKFYV